MENVTVQQEQQQRIRRELEAMRTIATTLQGLAIDQQERVLLYVSHFYGIELPHNRPPKADPWDALHSEDARQLYEEWLDDYDDEGR